MLPLATIRRLHDRGPGCRGLAVDPEGVVLGADCVLVRRTPRGYSCAAPDEIALLRRAVFDDDTRLGRLPIVLASIVRALDRGDLVMAQLLGLEIPLDELDDDRLWRLSRAADLIKAGFDPDQPRDDHGRWTSEGATGGAAAARVTAGGGTASSLLGRVTLSVLRGLAQLARGLSAPAAFLGIIFVPTNRSLITEGTLPDRPDLSFDFDEDAGVFHLYQDQSAGRRLLFVGKPDADGIIRDTDGRAIGRKLDSSVVILDPDSLPGSKPEDNKPKLCPDPGGDRPGPRDKDKAYQAYVSKVVNPEAPLPSGLAVKLRNPVSGKDVYFDDCRQSDGTMIDAKGTGYLEMLEKDSDYPWDGVEAKMLNQAKRQMQAAGSRPIEWHFAERDVTDYVRKLFTQKDVRITVIYTPPPR